MTAPRNEPRARARAGDEEARYRAAAELDPAAPADLEVLFALLGDPSWRVRTAAVERIAAAADPASVLPGLVGALSGGATIGARDAAAAALTRLGAPALEPLVAALSATDPDLRLASAAVLGDVKDRRAAAPLAARLADVDPNVRAAAAEALGKIGGPDAAATLLAALDADDPTLQLAAVEALAALRVCPDVERLEPLLRDRVLRRPAYRALGASDDPRALALLARGLSESARGARDAALSGLGMQRARRPAGQLGAFERGAREAAAHDGGVADGCAVALRSEEPFVAVGALTALAWIAEPRHVSPMLRLAEDDRLRPLLEDALAALPPGRELKTMLADAIPEQGPFGRIIALAALARLGSPAALESVIREASDSDSHVQDEAIAALGRLGAARAVAPLAGLLGDDAPGVSSRAANALVDIAQLSGAARAAALRELRDRAGASPSAALYRVLGAIGGAEDLPRLREGLRSPSVLQRVAAATAVGTLAQRGGVRGMHLPELIAAVTDPAWSVRAAAARAFAELGAANAAARDGDPALGEHPLCAEALGVLRGALADPEPPVQAAAADALGACGRRDQAGALAALLGGREPPAVVAVAALRALAAIGAAPVAVVTAAAAHSDPEVVKEAVAVAARLPGSEAERIVRDAAASPRWDVRRAAARAMLMRGDPALAGEAARRAADDPDPLVARAFGEAAHALGGGRAGR
jgi:HEAT repeat protein